MTETFAYVIVGGGSAGCVLANRLSEDASVLVIEAGPDDVPAQLGHPKLLLDDVGPADWGYRSTSQPGLRGRTAPVTHGRLLGGTSAINGLLYLRGDPTDYDTWVELGAPGWGAGALEPYFQRIENCVDVDEPGLGHAGPLHLEHLGAHGPHPGAHAFLDAATANGHKALRTFEGAGGLEGAGYFHANIREGRRFNAREAYLDPVRPRPNLTVWTDTRVTELIFAGNRCTGVRCRRGGAEIDVGADGEVILAASALESPKLLMLSGIGDPAALASIGVQVRVPLPGVGANLHDHVMVTLNFPSAGPAVEPYFLTEAAVFHRSHPGLAEPDLETIFVPRGIGADQDPGYGHAAALICVLVRPRSTGSLSLDSADPLHHPVIDPGFLRADEDVTALAGAVTHALDLARRPEMAPWIAGPTTTAGLGDHPAGPALHAWVRDHAVTHNHIAGSCRMGTDGLSVVDPSLRVHGTEGLRVVDVSVQPRIVSGHCQGSVLATAERAADLILDRSLAPSFQKETSWLRSRSI